jgi:hypothetical protein
VLRHFGPEYLRSHSLSTAQAKAWRAIVGCRTPALGGQLLRCDSCGAQQWRWHSCRNRHCPQCQARARDAWRCARLADLLDVPYCHLVFTLPHELNGLAAAHPRWVYDTPELVAASDHGNQRGGRGRTHAGQLHQLPGGHTVLGEGLDMPVVLRDALVQACHLAEQVTDDCVGPARQILQLAHGLAPHGGGLQWQDDAELRQQPSDAVDGGSALLNEPLAGAVHEQLRLLLDALGRNEPHIGPPDGLADGKRIGRVVLAALAREAVGHHELGRHQAHRVTMAREQPRPVMRARARFHADQARRQGRDQLKQLGASDAGTNQHRTARIIHAMHGKNVLGEIDSQSDNSHGLPLSNELMRYRTSHRGTSLPFAAIARLVRDGEVPFIR